jgi:D-cysteine desulfhydrase
MCTEGNRADNDTPVVKLNYAGENDLYIKRDDLLPYSFGGNKVRKAQLFFDEIDRGEYDCVVTYGSSHSNHCRVVANMAAARHMMCYIIAPLEVSEETFNSRFMKLFGAEILAVPVEQVHDTIENKLSELRADGRKPYFIAGGGHGNIGTEAYVQCYEEIRRFEKSQGIHFDYIFFASGTGTTHAGLVCGQLKHSDHRKIIGISIARKNPRGRNVVLESIQEYLAVQKLDMEETDIQERTIFVDDYTGEGYGRESKEIEDTIEKVMIRYGIPLDSTYTGKAFWGMERYLQKEQITGKTVLFIHTGGTPLFFDDLRRFEG